MSQTKTLNPDEREVLDVVTALIEAGYSVALNDTDVTTEVMRCLLELEAHGFVERETDVVDEDGLPRWRPTKKGEAALLAVRVDEGGVPC